MALRKRKALSFVLIFIMLIGNVKYPIMANELNYDGHTNNEEEYAHLPGEVCGENHEHTHEELLVGAHDPTGICYNPVNNQNSLQKGFVGSVEIVLDDSLPGFSDQNKLDLDDNSAEELLGQSEEGQDNSESSNDSEEVTSEENETEKTEDPVDEDIENEELTNSEFIVGETEEEEISFIAYEVVEGQRRILTEEISIIEIDYLSEYLPEKHSDEIDYTSILYDFEDNPSYLLIVYENGGYAIMHRASLIPMEYSSDSTIFEGFNGRDLYYAGPLSYYYKSGNDFSHIKTGETLEYDEVGEYIDITYQLNSELPNRDLEVIEYLDNETDIILNNLSMRAPAAPYNIQNYQDFQALEFGDNTGTICGSVATELILRYYSKFNNTAFLDPSYFNPGGDVRNNTFLPGFVADYRMKEGDISHGTYPHMDAFNLNYYLSDDSRRRALGYHAEHDTLSIQSIQDQIGLDNPVAIYLFRHDVYREHVVVAYGYKEDNNSLYYRIHSGWYTDCYDANTQTYPKVNDIYIYAGFPSITGAMWLEPTNTHTHDFDTVYSIEQAKPDLHFSTCRSCNLVLGSPHTFKVYTSEFTHSRKCTVCDIETDLCVPGSGDMTITDNGSTHTIDCRKCGLSITDTHGYEYTFLTDTQHLIQCKMCGKSNTENHRLDFPQITSSGHQVQCTSCNYDTSKSHSYGNWSGDSNSQHSRTCTGCNYKQSGSHSYGLFSYNSLTHTRSCSKCNYTEQTNHTFSPWSSNGAFSVSASEFDIVDDIYSEESIYTEPYEIDLPNYDEINIDYMISENEDCPDEDVCIDAHGISAYAIFGHSRNCTVCNYSESAAHSYQMSDSTSLQHKSVCSVCKSTVYESHSFSNWTSSGSFEHKRKCACGRTETQSHNMNSYSFIYGSTHTVSCTGCSYSKSENHTLSSYSSTGTSSHKRACTKCSFTETANHTFGNYSSTNTLNHSRTCTVCSYTESKSHNYGSWVSKNNDSSYHHRSCEQCGYSEKQYHSWGGWTANGIGSTHTRSCNTCRFSQTENHTISSWTTNLTTHSRNCTICGYNERGNHSYSGWSTTSSQHERKCNTCGYSNKASHSFGSWSSSSSAHERKCSVCNYVDRQSHNMPFSWSSNNGREHYKECTVCRYRQTEAHFFINKRCSTCGYNR